MSDSEICNYCLQDIEVVHDPRQLPCGHVFCLSCLKGDFTSGTSLYDHQCITCRREFDEIDFDLLPSIQTFEEKEDEPMATPLALYCDRCPYQLAVRYCIDCGDKICSRHLRFHDGYFEDVGHETLDILKYAENPKLYNKAIRCKNHRKECITMACERCYQYNCLQCMKGAILCNKVKTAHQYKPLDAVEAGIMQVYEDLLKEAADKLIEVSKVEKQAWAKHDQLSKKCEEMIKEVERKSEDQIEHIKSQTEKIKDSITSYRAEKWNQVLTFIAELTAKKKKIEKVRKATYKFLRNSRNSHVVDIIKVNGERIKLLTETNAMSLEACEWTDHCLRIGCKQQMEIELRPVNYVTPVTQRMTTPFFADGVHWNY